MADLPEDRKQKIREEEAAKMKAEAEFRAQVRREFDEKNDAPPVVESPPLPAPPPVQGPPPVAGPPVVQPSKPLIVTESPPPDGPPPQVLVPSSVQRPSSPPVTATLPPPEPRPARVRKPMSGNSLLVAACLLLATGIAAAGYGLWMFRSTASTEIVHTAKSIGDTTLADYKFTAPVPAEPTAPPLIASSDPTLDQPPLPTDADPAALPTTTPVPPDKPVITEVPNHDMEPVFRSVPPAGGK